MARPRPRVITCLALCVWLAVSAGAPAPAAAHPHATPPPMSLDFTMLERMIETQLMIEVSLIEHWLDEAWYQPEDPSDSETLSAITKALLERCTLTIDGKPLVLKPTSVQTLASFDMSAQGGEGSETIKVLFENPVEAPAQSMDIAWTNFSGILWEDLQEFPVMVEADRVYDSAILSIEEHLFHWTRRPPHFDWSQPIQQVSAPPAPTWSVPIPSLVLALIGLVLLSGLVLRGKPAQTRLGAAGLALALAGGLWATDIGRFETQPLWGGQSVLPSERGAEKIFTTLHENIYRAFANPGAEETEREREERIYGLLATSLAPELIDALYVDIYESLTLRQQNGVVCQVEKIEKVEGTIEFPSEAWATHFHVDWHWRIHGAIAHLGHTHRRINVYRARYLVKHDGGSWRIASIKVGEHRRIDEDAEGNLSIDQNMLDPQEPADPEAPLPEDGSK